MTTSAPEEQQPAGEWSAAKPQPAGPAAGVAYGGFWIRVVAWILDAIVIGVLSAALAPLFGAGSMIQTGTNQVEVNYGANAIGTLIGLLYFVGFWTLRGQTPGMIPFRLRVVRAADGTRPDWVVSLLRYVGLLISFVVLLIGVIWVAFDSRKQGWHDKIASTLVVRDAA
jgi:uncharacterized RDD family membrane protein YckC